MNHYDIYPVNTDPSWKGYAFFGKAQKVKYANPSKGGVRKFMLNANASTYDVVLSVNPTAYIADAYAEVIKDLTGYIMRIEGLSEEDKKQFRISLGNLQAPGIFNVYSTVTRIKNKAGQELVINPQGLAMNPKGEVARYIKFYGNLVSNGYI